MMCEASENEVDVNPHPSMPEEPNTEAATPVSNDTSVSHNVNYVKKCDESSVNTDKLCTTSDKNACSDKTEESVAESNIVASNENDAIMEQENENNPQDIPENGHIKPTESNGVNNERAIENTSNQSLNGHDNGTYINEEQNREVKENQNGSGK